MKVLISVDMEGITGVVHPEQTDSAHPEYARFRKLMTAEASAAVEGAMAGGATEVVVNDSHASMTNILIEELHPSAELISGSPKPYSMMQGIDSGIDRVFFVGYHAAAGTPGGIIEHTWQRNVANVALNGRPVGEIGLNAALAGSYGVPVVLVTGDKTATMEALELLGQIETVTVKEGFSRRAARSLNPSVARERILEAAARAIAIQAAPFVVEPPITLTLSFERPIQADVASLIPDSRRPNSRTVEWNGQEMSTVYRVFRAMTTLASGY